MTATAYPLMWPDGFPRAPRREAGKFKTTLPGALKNVQDSLRLFGNDSGKPVKDVILSSNVTLGASRPADPGIAVWFTWDGLQVCIPVDRYATPEANLQAIHHVIEARRVELRHGGLAIVRATFRGFLALPAPVGSGKRPWWTVLGVHEGAGLAEAETAFRSRARTAHPDAGGSDAAMAELNTAIAEARGAKHG